MKLRNKKLISKLAVSAAALIMLAPAGADLSGQFNAEPEQISAAKRKGSDLSGWGKRKNEKADKMFAGLAKRKKSHHRSSIIKPAKVNGLRAPKKRAKKHAKKNVKSKKRSRRILRARKARRARRIKRSRKHIRR